jgi:enoyl-CoA hydratase/carnithine racemase
LLSDPFLEERLAGDDTLDLVVVDSDDPGLPSPGSLPIVVLASGQSAGDHEPSWADAVVDPTDAALIRDNVAQWPLAATTLVVHLRAVENASIEHGLALESAAYSVLQSGPEFARWRHTDSHGVRDEPGDRVRMERDDDLLTVVLQRGGHNAIDARLRDELSGALAVALADESIRAVHLRGEGASFSSGGDLGEFGQRSDPASAHRIRLARSPARALHRLSARTTAHIHGHTLGGGLELAAFAGWVVADPATRLGLPELTLGLIPGAGGTVSVTRRIGRRRTAHLALTARTIDATTALAWGLVDEIGDVASVSARGV